MKKQKRSRRDILKSALKGSTALALGTVFASVARAAAPPAEAITPQLIEAAKKEGRVVYYTSIDLPVAERIAKAFEATYPGIASGKTMRRNSRKPDDPRFCAASSIARSIFRRAAERLIRMKGK